MATKRTAAPEKVTQILERSKDVFGTVASETEDLYHEARTWVPDNYGKVAILSSAAAGLCLLGYAAGRRRSRRVARAELPMAGAVQVPEIDIAPFIKFLKLWMVYRVATKG
jgi:hypothetical protein